MRWCKHCVWDFDMDYYVCDMTGRYCEMADDENWIVCHRYEEPED